MTDAATVNAQAPSIDQPAKRPPALRAPKAIQGVAFAGFRRWMLGKAFGRYGRVIVLELPFFGRTVVVSDQCAAQPQQDLRARFGVRTRRR